MITQAQRDAYRYALEDKGVPEVIAFMAARNLRAKIKAPAREFSVAILLYGGFFWDEAPEGNDFWRVIVESAS
jgi:hypothetical protein